MTSPPEPDETTGRTAALQHLDRWAARCAQRFPPSADLKLAMAASGTLFSGYTLVHMLGNLQVYLGRGVFDGYARHLRTLGAPVLPPRGLLWMFRGVLLAGAVAHVGGALVLTIRARQAGQRARTRRRPRPQGRRRAPWETVKRSMRSTGTVLGLFAAHHIADLTLGSRIVSARHVEGAAYDNLMASLRRPEVAALYLAAMLALAAHISQGARQVGNDTGLSSEPTRRERLERAGRWLGTGVALGNATIPVAVILRIIR